MFSKVRVAGALLRESHSWYRTHVLSRSSMKPFSWDLGGAGRVGVGPERGGASELGAAQVERGRARARPKQSKRVGWGE